MKGAIRPWADDLDQALTALSGDFALIVVGPGPLEYHAPAAADQQVARVKAARAKWANAFTFHLFSKDRELRWDHGVGTELTAAADGDCDLTPAEWLVAPEAKSAFGSGSKLSVSVFVSGGRHVDYKLEALS